MKKNKLTAEFFENAICKNKDMETKEYWSNIFKSNLKTFLDEVDENDFKEIRDDVNSDYLMDYNTYQNHYSFICEVIDTDMEDTYKPYKRKIDKIEKLSEGYSNIIKNFPDNVDYAVEFSKSSLSVYLNINIPVTEDNIGKFLNIGETIRGINITETYSEYEESDYKNKTIVIRMSDHDFGGNRDYSYRIPCINIVLENK